jgi:hypothetical protein
VAPYEDGHAWEDWAVFDLSSDQATVAYFGSWLPKNLTSKTTSLDFKKYVFFSRE